MNVYEYQRSIDVRYEFHTIGIRIWISDMDAYECQRSIGYFLQKSPIILGSFAENESSFDDRYGCQI